MGCTIGRIVGFLGGILTIVGTVLPWATISGGTLTSPQTFTGVGAGFGAWIVLIFGLLGLILVIIEKRITAILALVFGILALLLTLLFYAGLTALATQAGGSGVLLVTEYGVWVALLGTIILVVGGALAVRERKKPVIAPQPGMAPPMSPPMPPST